MRKTETRAGKTHPVRGALAGAAGGLVASFVMNEFQAGVSKGTKAVKEATASPEEQKKMKEQQQEQERQQQKGTEPDDTTQKTADAIAEATTGQHLSKEQKKTYGPVVHYGFGATMGAIYGLLAEYSETARSGFGTLFGTVLFLGADETAVPLLGLSASPTEQPITAQIQPWLSHLVYGATAELVRRGARKIL